MKRFSQFRIGMRRSLRRQEGQALIEYGILSSLIAGMTNAFHSVGNFFNNMFTNILSNLHFHLH